MLILMRMNTIIGGEWSTANAAACWRGVARAVETMRPMRSGALEYAHSLPAWHLLSTYST